MSSFPISTAGAIARRVLDELESLGCDTKTGCTSSDIGDAAMAAFAGRTLADYYTEGMTSTTGEMKLSDYLKFLTLVNSSYPQAREVVSLSKN